tara:strand:- start:200 stop:1774 length:1575 start_codon:yes stop_codon:yes gene_type:complete
MITFDPVGAAAFTVGGATVTNPFPKYSISREVIRSGDDTPIANVYSITVTGQMLASGDITVVGDRQNNLQKDIITALLNPLLTTDQAVGTLTIEPYGGKANKIIFRDARLNNVQIAEQSDESAGVQIQNYTFDFTAHVDISIGGGDDPFSYRLRSAEETWDLVANDGEFTFDDNDIKNENPRKTYTITHTVTATGLKKFAAGPILHATDGPAWKQAKLWCESRLKNPNEDIDEDASGTPQYKFQPDEDLIADLITDGGAGNYSYYNNNRVANVDYAGGTYSITETWFASNLPATNDIEVSMDQGDDGSVNITVTGTITGKNLAAYSSNYIDPLVQAEAALPTVLGFTFDLAKALYISEGPGTPDDPDTSEDEYTDSGRTLNTLIRTESIGKNKVTGAITYSRMYNDRGVTVTNALTDDVTVTYDNQDRTVLTVAILEIIGKSTGPIIQDMGTTPQRNRTLQVDVVMKRANRIDPPTRTGNVGLKSIITAHKPSSELYPNVAEQTANETWNPRTGAYSLSLEWVY